MQSVSEKRRTRYETTSRVETGRVRFNRKQFRRQIYTPNNSTGHCAWLETITQKKEKKKRKRSRRRRNRKGNEDAKKEEEREWKRKSFVSPRSSLSVTSIFLVPASRLGRSTDGCRPSISGERLPLRAIHAATPVSHTHVEFTRHFFPAAGKPFAHSPRRICFICWNNRVD